MKQFKVGKVYKYVNPEDNDSGAVFDSHDSAFLCEYVDFGGDAYTTKASFNGTHGSEVGPVFQGSLGGWCVASLKDLNSGVVVEVHA